MSAPVSAGDVEGPGRFCGYAPVIDLLPGESVTTLEGGIHSGKFRWDGVFGSLEVNGIGWASKPPGRIVKWPTDKGHARFAQRKRAGLFAMAIWNRRNGAAYFSSKKPITPEQIGAIDRVDLFDELGPEPTGCKLRTIFVWE